MTGPDVLPAGREALAVRDWRLARRRVFPVVRRGEVLLRVSYVKLTPLDLAVAGAPHFYEEGRIVGYSCTGIVVEPGVSVSPTLQGAVAVRGFKPDYTPPLGSDGCASEYAPVPAQVLAEVAKAEPKYAYLADACIACEAYEAAGEVAGSRVLVYGAGASSIMLAQLLSGRGFRVELVTSGEHTSKMIREGLGVTVSQKPSSEGYSFAFIASTLYREYAASTLEEGAVLVVHPHIYKALGGLHIPYKRLSRLEVRVAWGLGARMGCCLKLVEEWWQLFSEKIPVVEGLNPPPQVPSYGVLLAVRASP